MVHADFSRIVISTNRETLSHAKGYVAFLLRALAENSLLEWLVLPVMRTWHALLWRDPSCYVGIAEPALSPPPGHRFGEEGERGSAGERGAGSEASRGGGGDGEGAVVEVEWGDKQLLPEPLHEHFDAVAGRFLLEPWMSARAREGAEVRTYSSRMTTQRCV